MPKSKPQYKAETDNQEDLEMLGAVEHLLEDEAAFEKMARGIETLLAQASSD